MDIKTVVLDPGHGGKDPGAVAFGREEKAQVLALAKQVQGHLEKQGILVHLTRTTDQYVPLAQRPQLANHIKADVLVSLHRNAFEKMEANGVEIWVHSQGAATNIALATQLLERLEEVGIQSNRGIKQGSYWVLTGRAPAAMVELGFITNPADNELFDQHFEGYAKALACGICQFLGVPFDQEAPPQYARIQLGAYTYPENEAGARRDLEKIRVMGLDAFLVIPSDERVEPA